jgi:ectoine hydroxylase-related dioxygenase (phytanoyl-CoA dioxygenase family)
MALSHDSSHPLGTAQVAALDREGYVVAHGASDGASLAKLRRAFDGAPEQQRGTQHVALTNETPEHATWEALARHPVVLAAARHVLARAAFRVGELHGRNPLPGYGQQGLHADWPPRGPGSPFYVVTVIAMIDEFTVANGATRVVPGTHLRLGAVPKSLAQPLAHHPDERVVTGPAGSLLVMNGHLWHSGRRNDGAGPRRAAQMVIVDASQGAYRRAMSPGS